MKATKIVGFLIIAVILGVGLYLIQSNKQKKALAAHNAQKFQRITKSAQKSGAAGLLVMASTINKYYQIKGYYPKDLSQLYPEFIPNEPFILTLNWKYYPENKTYLIIRNATGSKALYSMGPEMKLKTVKDQASTPIEKIVSVKTRQTSKKSEVYRKPASKPELEKRAKREQLSKVLTPDIITKQVKIKSNDTVVKKNEQKFIFEKNELNHNEKFLLSFNGDNLYIWKTHKGIIGFSDIQYPEEKELSIYKNKGWIKLEKHSDSRGQKQLF